MPNFLSPTAVTCPVRPATPSVYRGPSVPDRQPMPRQNLLRSIILNLTGAITCTAGNNTVAKTKKGDEWAAVSRIRVITNGTDVLCDLSGDQLWWLNFKGRRVQPTICAALGDGATANPSFDSTLEIPIWLLNSTKPSEGAYETFRPNNLEIEITYADWTSINASATAWTTNPAVAVYVSEQEPSPLFSPPWVTRVYAQTYDFAGAQTAGRCVLDSGPGYQSIYVNVQAQNGGDDLINTLTNLKLVQGTTTHFNMAANPMLQWGRLNNGSNAGLEIDSTNIARQTRQRISQGSDPRAWYDLSIVRDLYMSEAIVGVNSNDLYLEVATSAACRIVVLSQQIFPNKYYNPADVAAAKAAA